ncbi:unnamed protein product [Ceratitis capitata]|uniref:(Mediterranean fruit fly) hypothetical protein n=1 Tax=Ceratitis capitata TaxID=7213 RepID=A0A811V0T8_CERCA|nr:unnamed protein product [Ceratitis capitata]
MMPAGGICALCCVRARATHESFDVLRDYAWYACGPHDAPKKYQNWKILLIRTYWRQSRLARRLAGRQPGMLQASLTTFHSFIQSSFLERCSTAKLAADARSYLAPMQQSKYNNSQLLTAYGFWSNIRDDVD